MEGISLEKIKKFIKQEIVLCAAVFLAIVSSFFHRPTMDSIDFGVLSVLLALMLVVAGLKSIRFLDWLAVEFLNKCTSLRQVNGALILITYISSMFVTNDVALLTFVPLTLVIRKRLRVDMVRTIVLQTMAANLGSMATPPGNPQNLFLYSHFHYTASKFFLVMAGPTLLAALFLGILMYRGRNKKLTLTLEPMEKPSQKLTYLYLGLLLLNIAAVLHFVDKYIALAITVIFLLVINKGLFKVVDYSLLITFVGFFVFIGNISQTSFVDYLRTHVLGTAFGTYLAGLALSQVISNVPAAMLLAGLTDAADALLLGVNIGGLGTLIASMASVISYKIYTAEHPYQASVFLKTFTVYNLAGLVIIGIPVAIYFY
ncbi:MAG: SLC13 family permease [Phascolarctobacterium sp.]|nr:SLC13 family permease [Phascolarctobacterium sp.]